MVSHSKHAKIHFTGNNHKAPSRYKELTIFFQHDRHILSEIWLTKYIHSFLFKLINSTQQFDLNKKIIPNQNIYKNS